MKRLWMVLGVGMAAMLAVSCAVLDAVPRKLMTVPPGQIGTVEVTEAATGKEKTFYGRELADLIMDLQELRFEVAGRCEEEDPHAYRLKIWNMGEKLEFDGYLNDDGSACKSGERLTLSDADDFSLDLTPWEALFEEQEVQEQAEKAEGEDADPDAWELPIQGKAIDLSGLGEYEKGDVQYLGSFETGDLFASRIGGEGCCTAVYLQDSSNARILAEWEGVLEFQLVPGTEEYPYVLLNGHYDYGENDSYDKYTEAVFVFAPTEETFYEWIAQPCSNTIVLEEPPQLMEQYRGLAWTLCGGTEGDSLVPFDLYCGETRKELSVAVEGQMSFFYGLGAWGTHIIPHLQQAEDAPFGTIVVAQYTYNEETGEISRPDLYECSVLTGQWNAREAEGIN